MNDNLPGAITLCKSALNSIGIALYEEVQEPMKETVKVITGMVEDMNEAMAEKGFDGLIEAFEIHSLSWHRWLWRQHLH